MRERSESFGRYLLLEQLAAGGMARVYRAVLRDPAGFAKQVALKRVLEDYCRDADFLTRFTDEARIVSTLNHSNIVQVFDFGQVDGEYYLAMEMVDGPDLGSLLQACQDQDQPLPIATAVYIAAEMARGLGAAHTRTNDQGQVDPVVHRDVSPQNVLISRSGEVKVVDFGIAKATDKAHKTRTGIVMGKLQYMSPEQARGDQVDPRADIFSAGCVLHEMLAGQPLFSASSPGDLLQMIIRGPIARVADANPDVPPALEKILSCCLEREPPKRYSHGARLARELETLLHRMAPEFSPDDLAKLVQALVPAPVQGDSAESALTRPVDAADAAALADTADAQLALAETAVADVAKGAGVAARVVPLKRKRRPLLLLVVLSILVGLLGGLLGGLLTGSLAGHPVSAIEEKDLRPGEPLSHQQWTLTLQSIRRQDNKGELGNRMLLSLALVPPPGGSIRGAGRDFRLVLDSGAEEPALFWAISKDRLGLVFGRTVERVRLLFRPKDASALRLRVEEP